jgi:N-acetylneuraminate synthase
MQRTITIGGRPVGPGHPPFLIAEMSGNHNGDLKRALAIMEVAKEAGADAIKLQTYTADTITIDCDKPDFVIKGGLWDGRTLYGLYQEASTPWDWHEQLFAKGRELGVPVFSTPFDATAVDFLERLGAPAHKIASFELIDTPLLRKVAATGKPVIASTGMANLGEIAEAVRTLQENGCEDLILLHCVSGYPVPAEESNLRTIPHLAATFDLPVGLSDHTLDPVVATAAVAAGAVVVEKHFTISRADGGPDASFSLEPKEFAELARSLRTTFAALGHVNYERTASEVGNVQFRRSIYVVRDMAAGEAFSPENIRIIRPGHGLEPKHYDAIIGKSARRSIARGTPMGWGLVGE